MNFIKVQDHLLTKQECTEAIEWCHTNIGLIEDINKERVTGYDYCNLMDQGGDYIQSFSALPLRPVFRAIETLKESYTKSFSEVNRLQPWKIQYVRLKRWSPNYSYSHWHSEHQKCTPDCYRVMSFLIYLTDNDAHTEFRRHRNVKTKAGRGLMFPAYFTHEHRGSVCKKGLDRYIVSGYYGFI